MSQSELPPLDCHAHIAPDVTVPQVAGLAGALVFAMTRTPTEAAAAARRHDNTIVWGFGIHPGVPAALTAAAGLPLATLLDDFVLVGEVGLDRRGPAAPQTHVLESVLDACKDRPVLLSLHSTGRTRELLAVLRQQPHPGALLHWFNGTLDEIAQAVELGCYFSVNNAMSDERLAAIPAGRTLPETDFPSSRRTVLASRPGHLTALEHRIGLRDGMPEADVRRRWWQNLGRVADAAQATPRLPAAWRDALTRAAID